MIDLRNCKPGDKLLSNHGMVLTYVKPLENNYMDHEVTYPDTHPYYGSRGTRTHDGYVMRNVLCRLDTDHNIVEILGQS